MAIMLSVLIPTVPPRYRLLNRLLFDLERQMDEADLVDEIEILILGDNFERSIGDKRNELLEAANGKYVCFIDDDDTVHKEYCRKVVEALRGNDCDCVGYYKSDHTKIITASCKSSKNIFEFLKMPVKATLAKQIQFPDWSMLEDGVWGRRLFHSGLLKSEHFIDEVMYLYSREPKLSLSQSNYKKKGHIQTNHEYPWCEQPLKGYAVWIKGKPPCKLKMM